MCGRGGCERNGIKAVAAVWSERGLISEVRLVTVEDIDLRRVCVGRAEVSEGLYDEFRIWRRCEFASEGKSKGDRIAGEMC